LIEDVATRDEVRKHRRMLRKIDAKVNRVLSAGVDSFTTQATTITHTAPTTADYAVQDLIDSGVGSAFGFATKDEGNTVLQVIANLQTRVQELEEKLSAMGVLG
jgi:hypothetical protein